LIKIKEQRVEGDYLITLYENGAEIKSLIKKEIGNLEHSYNPLLKLEKENDDLKEELGGLKLAIAELSKMKEV